MTESSRTKTNSKTTDNGSTKLIGNGLVGIELSYSKSTNFTKSSTTTTSIIITTSTATSLMLKRISEKESKSLQVI